MRTGTGSIAVAAGNNIALGNSNSAIYTAGETADPVSGFTASDVQAIYAKNGGNLSIYAQGDIKGQTSNQIVTDWLYRQGQVNADGTFAANSNPSWWLHLVPVTTTNKITKKTTTSGGFMQNFGTLGGGDLELVAGGNIINASAVIPTTGRVSGSNAATAKVDVQGGGDLAVHAGGDIKSGVFYVGHGHGELTAGGSIVSGTSTGNPVYSVLVLGDGDFKLTSSGDLHLGTVMNPTVYALGSGQKNVTSFFFTYAPTSKVSLTSIAGDVTLENNISDLNNLTKLTNSSDEFNSLLIYPGSLAATALGGNIEVNKQFSLFPSATGNLSLLAEGNITTHGQINMSDLDPGLLPGVTTPVSKYTDTNQKLVYRLKTPEAHSAALLHSNDKTPVRIIAEKGDIIAQSSAQEDESTYLLPKSALIEAGRDIVGLDLLGQNVHASDETTISAGRDIYYILPRNDSNSLKTNFRTIELSGPGRLLMTAGRNIDLGNSVGVVTKGNQNNLALPDQGADITVIAGVANANSNATFADNGIYTGFSDTFFGALRDSGRETDPIKKYTAGLNEIGNLFPNTSYKGDLNLFFSQIKTERGGNIDIFVPGGAVNAGLANIPMEMILSKVIEKDIPLLPSLIGVVTMKGGNVRAVSSGDFLVNSSRVFTLQGGDILLWSSEGNIDAGKGAKTAQSVPPPIITPQADGSTKVEYRGAATGSGIRVLLTGNAKAGSVDLIAPKGFINAGDAGIGSAGDLHLAAVRVDGASNIQVTGTATGIPVASTPVAAGLTGVSNPGADAGKTGSDISKNLGDAARSTQETYKPSFLNVEVIGLGE